MSVNGYNSNATEPVSNSDAPLTPETFEDEYIRIERELIERAPENQLGMPDHLNRILLSIAELKKAAANLKAVPAAAATWEKLAAFEIRVYEQYTHYREMEGGKRKYRKRSRKFRARKNRRTRHRH